MLTQTINLNMSPGSVNPVVHVNQYDKDSSSLKFNLYQSDGSAFTIPASSAVVINGTKPDGYGFSYSATYTQNVVTANLDQQMTAVAGDVKCELRITNNDNVIGTQNFTLAVEEAALDNDTVVSDSDIPAIAAAADYALEAAASAADAAAIVATATSFTQGTPTRINSGSIDDLTTPGYYYCVLNSVSDLPEGTNGDVFVFNTLGDGSVNCFQIFRRAGSVGVNDNNIYMRSRNASSWGAWWKYGDDTQYKTTSMNLTSVMCFGHITGSQQTISFYVPFPNFIGSTLIIDSLSLVCRHVAGGYLYIRSGNSGSTYTSLGSSAVSVLSGGTAVRTNEISSVNIYVRQGSGVQVSLDLNYKACIDSAGTLVVNNSPAVFMATISGTFS